MNRRKTYTMYHVHTHFSNCTTNIDSIAKPEEYIDFAIKNNMKALAFSEHGNAFSWLHKKVLCEKAGLKYIHGVEMYITEALKITEKENISDKTCRVASKSIRDNYHIGLYAKNWEGVKEINKLISKSHNREDGSFYYNPRIDFETLINTSNNIIVTTACVGGILRRKKQSINIYNKFIKFLTENKERCFLEVQPHQDDVQIEYNKELKSLSKETGIRLIGGTDTHALNDIQVKGRKLLQIRKGIHFNGEDAWILKALTYDELFNLFQKQGIFTDDEIIDFIENTNVLADMVSEFTVDTGYKYPKLSENPLQELRIEIMKGIKEKGIDKLDNYESEYLPKIREELDVYIENGAIDFLMLDLDIKKAMKKKKVFYGPGRGSVTGSVIAYLIGLTEINPIKEGLNFQRFMNKERISLGDIDTDWCPTQRNDVKDYIFKKKGVYCADIVTFNTLALKGAIREVCPVLYKEKEESKRIIDYICSNVDNMEEELRKEFPNVFEYVDMLQGVIVSVGTHASGTVVSPVPLEGIVGVVSIKTNDKPVTMLNMKDIEMLNFVKLDILGLDNIELINKTCEIAGIERLTPDNVPYDENVWRSLRDDTTCIFQWESDSASEYIKKLFSDETIEKIKKVNSNFNFLDLFSVGNGALRPAGASYRDKLAHGIFHDNGHPALNELFRDTLGYLVYQEQIIDFLNKFCGYSMGEADIVRRAFSKKTGTEIHLPRIKEGFIKTMKKEYGTDEERANKILEDILIVINDASDYLFSKNHSQPYSYIGYISAYLRYYYPLEFFTSALNVFDSKMEKTAKIIKCIKERNIKIEPPTYGKSRAEYFFDKQTNTIYKGLQSVKFINGNVAENLFTLSKKLSIINFVDIINISTNELGINLRQLEVLVKIGYFREFGTIKDLLNFIRITKEYNKKTFKKDKCLDMLDTIRNFAKKESEKTFTGVDGLSLCKYMCEKVKTNEELSLLELAKFEAELIGSVSIIDKSLNKKTCIVLDVNTKHTPKLRLYRLNNGDIIDVMVYKNFFKEKPIEKYDSIYVANCEKKAKRIITSEGKWAETNDYRFYITYYKLS